MSNAKLVVTDSGGIQEETTCLGIQCITVRDNTERPVTVESGTNHLVGTDPEKIIIQMKLHNLLKAKLTNEISSQLLDELIRDSGEIIKNA